MKNTSRIKNVIIGQALQYRREASRLSRSSLAKKLDIQPQYIANWERGQCLPPKKIIGDLIANLNMSKKEIVNLYTKATKVALNEYFEEI